MERKVNLSLRQIQELWTVNQQNPRYLQTRPDLFNPKSVHLALSGTRLRRKLSHKHSVLYPVRSVLPGRRNNPAEDNGKIRPLCCFGPIHYLELPELLQILSFL